VPRAVEQLELELPRRTAHPRRRGLDRSAAFEPYPDPLSTHRRFHRPPCP
jgi:hypothetical protein